MLRYCVAVVLLFAFGEKACCIPLSQFYRYGPDAGDESNPLVDDGASRAITLNFRFPFFGTRHTTIYVNNNGIITFNEPIRQYTSEPFPLSGDRMIIAPFWADSDIRHRGQVWHRQTTNQTLLSEAMRQVRSAFVSHMDFEPTHLFIATWDHVTYYQGSFARDLNTTNTFQCVMITDEVRSFVIFNYADGEIQWTTGDASQGMNGLGGIEAQVGFNAGDGERYANVPGSQTRDILNIDTTSNIGIAGVWLFRVDAEEMIPPQPCISGNRVALSIGPRSGSQFGGTAIYISGPCFHENDTILCFFDGDYRTSGYYVSNTTAICVSPRFETPGWKSLFVQKIRNQAEENSTSGRSQFYAEHPEDTTHITLADQNTVILNVSEGNNERITVRWNPQSILPTMEPTSYMVDINLYRFERSSDVHNPIVLQHYIDIMRNQQNNGTATFPVPESNVFTTSNNIYPVAIKISIGRPLQANSTLIIDLSGRAALWTSTLYYLEYPQFGGFCRDWINSQTFGIGEAIRERLPPCPWRVDQARAPNSGLTEDRGYWIQKANRFFHPGAATCFRQSTFTREHMGSGQQCCYRQNGDLIVGPGSGGTVDLYAPNGLENSFNHYHHDVIPAISCCKGSERIGSMYCNDYYEHRPSDNGSRYNPPVPACVYGDPHIVTLDGFKYTFNGLGEFVLIETNDSSFSLQGRMVQAEDDEGGPAAATVFSAIVGKELYSDTVQFQLGDDDMDVLVNGELLNFDNLAVQDFNNATVTKGNRSASAVFSSGVYVEVREANGILSTLLVSLGESYRSRTSGLMGNFNGDQTDDLLPRGSITGIPLTSSFQQIHNSFGLSWIISNQEDSLFSYSEDESFRTFFMPGFLPAFEPIFPSPALQQQANSICGNDQFCLFDIATTGRTDIGLSTLLGGIELEMITNISQPVICNPPCEFGVCVETDTCSCADGYTGDTCATPVVGECELNPCENGGMCTLIATTAVCTCVNGYSGLFCEREDQFVSGSGIPPPACNCSRDIECSLIGQLKNSQFTPTTNQLKCTITVEPEPTVRNKFIVDSSFNTQYLSPGSLSFLASIGVLTRNEAFSSCAFDGDVSLPFIDSLGTEFISIIYTKLDGSFGSLDLSMSSLQEIMSGRDDFTVGMDLDEVNLCSLQNLLQWLSVPQPAQVGTCRDPNSDSGVTIAYFPVNCLAYLAF